MVRSRIATLVLNLSLLLTILTAPRTYGAAACDAVARMVSVQGSVEVRRVGQTTGQPARLNDLYCAGDQISVGERSRADVALTNEPLVRLDQNTTLTLSGAKPQGGSIIDLIHGVIYFFSRLPRNLDINTTYVNAGVEGTEGLVAVEANRTLISIFEGRVLAANAAGSLAVTRGRSAVAEQGRAPILAVVARPRDAVRWALYYVPTLYFRAGDFPAGPDWQGAVRNSIEALNRRDYTAAFDAVRNMPANLAEPRLVTYRASLLLVVGRSDDASRDLEQALSLSPNHSDALALQAIIAVVQNDKDRALELARRAVGADTKSAGALIALSYAQQANFDLDGALASLQQAVQVSSDNALAWARLAEVWLMFAQLNEALQAAEKAVALDPNLARTQTVLGFAYLTQVNTAQARRAFEHAIELDNADPLPRLGLGLAKIRDGELIDGRKEIDIAVSLDPDNALIRSYLGKAYFEEKRDPQASDQYEISKLLDPKDPTPFFYDAIRKQTTNRPVEALQDLQKAVELNDNRAVYRSRQLLDSDAAARSAALGRIYSDLGFQQLALVEGWKSVNTDPANFSAHRLLADSYSVLPRHEIARVSELLQSQLLQPLNATPIQPRLAESNLFLISASGPAGLSYNEFNPIFNRNGLNFQTTGLAGENRTYSGEGVLSGIYKKLAFSLGGFHYRTDGWRVNAGQKDSLANAFVQAELSPSTSIQAEYRYRSLFRGDNRQRFFFNDFSIDQENREERFTGRVGLRHAFSPNSTLLASYIYQSADASARFGEQSGFIAAVLNPEKSWNAEIQHLYGAQSFSFVSGMGVAKVSGSIEPSLTILSPFFFFIPLPVQSTDLRHINVYTYAKVRPFSSLEFILGASGDFTSGENQFVAGKHQFNPKFGMVWNPWKDTTIRTAVFRVLKRTLSTSQTIEPTQVAGFNQFFDDANGARAWRYGVGVDQKFSHDLFAGAEVSGRKISNQALHADLGILNEQKSKEFVNRNYLFWMPHPQFAVTVEYLYERLTSESSSTPTLLNTHRLPFGVRWFHPMGWSTGIRATYVNQAGNFKLIDDTLWSGRSQFFNLDAAVDYRLPDRLGFVSLGVNNLADRQFRYFERDVKNQSLLPKRNAFLKVTFALP